jgi:hypothetical protein
MLGEVEAVIAQSDAAERNTMPVKVRIQVAGQGEGWVMMHMNPGGRSRGGMGNDTYEFRWQVKGRGG